LCDIAAAYHNRRKWVKHITRLKIYFAQKNASCIEIWNPLAGRIYMLADISDISSISIPHDTRLGLHKLHDLWYTLNTKTITKRWVLPMFDETVKKGGNDMTDYLSIEGMTEDLEGKVKQDLKYKTGNFLWKVKFNVPLDPKTVNNVNLYVTTENLSPLKTAIRYNSLENIIEIEPLEPYAQDETYILNITTNVTSLSGKALREPQQLRFKI
jgi:hypothetical protein